MVTNVNRAITCWGIDSPQETLYYGNFNCKEEDKIEGSSEFLRRQVML